MNSCICCGEKYGVFNRERSCGQCGRIYCGNCLKDKARVSASGHSGQKLPVCRSCFRALSQPVPIAPAPAQLPSELPTLLLKDIEHRRATAERSQRDAALNAPLEQRLKQLSSPSGAQRIATTAKQKPQQQGNAPPTLEELETRLRALQGESTAPPTSQPSYAAAAKPLPLLPPKKPDGVAVDDLLSEVMDEVSIEQMRPQYESREMRQIEERLAALREPPVPPAGAPKSQHIAPPTAPPTNPANSTSTSAASGGGDLRVRFEALERDIERTLADANASRSPTERLQLEQLLRQLKALRESAPSFISGANSPPSRPH